MKLPRITQDEYDKFEMIDGTRVCPSGDYRDMLAFRANSRFGAYSRFGADSRFGAYSFFGADSFFGARSSFGNNSCFGAECIATSPIWAFQYDLPFKTVGKIYPYSMTRMFWGEKLGMNLTNKCYGEIEKELKPQLEKILQQKQSI